MSLLLAFVADLWFGDPEYRYHPVRVMGRLIERGETFFRRLIRRERVAGAVFAIGFPLVVFVLVGAGLFLFQKIHPLLAHVFNILGIYTAISVHDLKKEAEKIHGDLVRRDFDQARKDLARIVGRDTGHLEETDIARATVETVAESLVDGIVAPLFYAALGGAPLALTYKAVNTLDSMIGHLNERYRDFGFAAAKQDVVWNWIPARLSYGLVALAAFFSRKNAKAALTVGWSDGVVSGENSAIPEAAFAGALEVRLGGENRYEGRIVKKPFLGTPVCALDVQLIPESIRLMLVTAWITVVICIGIEWHFKIL